MTELTDSLKVVLADTFAFYLKAHNYHWNVEGPNFPQYHKFLQKLYEEVFEAADRIAEQIRAQGEYAPGSFSRYSDLTTIKDAVSVPDALIMFKNLADDNDKVIASLKTAYKDAEDAGEIGVSNFLQDRTDIHKKHGWMLRSTIKNR